MTEETITEFLTALRDGEVDGIVPELENLVHARRYEIDKARANDELDMIGVEIDQIANSDRSDYRESMALYNRLMHWKREHGKDDPRLRSVVEKLLKTCFSLNSGATEFVK